MSSFAKCPCPARQRRSRKGAWIEILDGDYFISTALGRSRKGAWIEIAANRLLLIDIVVAPARERGLKCRHKTSIFGSCCRSRKGAWIEICLYTVLDKRAQSRSRKGAWIEIVVRHDTQPIGLQSLPQGSVD